MPQIHEFLFSFNSGLHDLIAKYRLGYLNENISLMKIIFHFYEMYLKMIWYIGLKIIADLLYFNQISSIQLLYFAKRNFNHNYIWQKY